MNKIKQREQARFTVPPGLMALSSAILVLLIVGTALIVGSSLNDSIKDDLADCTTVTGANSEALTYNSSSNNCDNTTQRSIGQPNNGAFDATENTTASLTNLSQRLPLLSTALMFGLIISVVVGAFALARFR